MPRWDDALRIATLVTSVAGCALGGLALWRTRDLAPAATAASGARAAAPSSRDEDHAPGDAARPFALRLPRAPRPRAAPDEVASRAPLDMRVLSNRGAKLPKPPPPALAPLAEKLRVRGDALEPFVDASGRVSPAVEARLTRARSAGLDIASRLKLSSDAGEGFASVLVDYVLRVAGASTNGATPDAEAVEAWKADAVSAVRATGGDAAADEAKRMIETL